MAAAISDYIPTTKKGKLKKQDIGNEMQLTLYENIDILKSLQGNNLVKIAFKAECDAENAIKNAIKILDSKNCAMVCLNIISENNMSFGNNTNQMYFLTKDTRCKIQDNKFNISLKLCQHIESLGL
ncbi:hypothetical protein CQA53_08170 [Helicobacter didelphidarum]|uniref:DNA/pantothenate metabolism flavoprotein C-terminal domain-containing protein n=2 Tax=Helicobacter didelphidarum TaxID=2040648 RepID=A0A3D8IFT4_9HELI|nr:hypothetical protein CQA53_08170 [Helicobacter didelphidarum]